MPGDLCLLLPTKGIFHFGAPDYFHLHHLLAVEFHDEAEMQWPHGTSLNWCRVLRVTKIGKKVHCATGIQYKCSSCGTVYICRELQSTDLRISCQHEGSGYGEKLSHTITHARLSWTVFWYGLGTAWADGSAAGSLTKEWRASPDVWASAVPTRDRLWPFILSTDTASHTWHQDT